MSNWEFIVSGLIVTAVALVVVLPILAVYLLTLGDVIFRIDIGISKMIWLGAVLLIPLGGVLFYWALRPKSYDPLYETGEIPFSPARRARAVPVRPSLRLVPNQSVTAPVPAAEEEPSLEKAA